MRTLTIKSGGGGGNFDGGWNHVEITKAKYGDWEGSKYIDVWFKDFPETLNLRCYAKKGKDGEEFAIGRLFRFANAGLTESLDSEDGTKIVKLDDSPDQLVGKMLNVYLYKDGEYYRILAQPAPTEFTNIVESFKENDITYWKGKAVKYFHDYVEKNVTPANGASFTSTNDDVFASMPD
tara:strand:- start:1470 stop:2006 length:537 start_codon:yes stop_codon:yes gene_type:complete